MTLQQSKSKMKLNLYFFVIKKLISKIKSILIFSWKQFLKNQPFATIPCLFGGRPVNKVDCTVQVTAGVTVEREHIPPFLDNLNKLGVCSPIIEGDNPTTLITKFDFKDNIQ